MPDQQANWILPFLAGAVSFLSPCVMPLIPGYLSYVSGASTRELEVGAAGHAGLVFGQSLLFILGFSLVFVALVGAVLMSYRLVLSKVAGLFIILMGLYLLGAWRLGALARQYRFHPHEDDHGRGPLSAILLGGSFASAWTPCVGPILASILIYAGSAATVKTGALLLFIYALGLGVPFILTALAFTRAVRALRWLRRFSRPIETASGTALVAVVALLLTNKMFYVSIWAQRMFSRFGPGSVAVVLGQGGGR